MESLWKLAGLIVDSVEAQILCLKAENVEVICSIIEANIQEKLTTVRLFRQSNEQVFENEKGQDAGEY